MAHSGYLWISTFIRYIRFAFGQAENWILWQYQNQKAVLLICAIDRLHFFLILSSQHYSPQKPFVSCISWMVHLKSAIPIIKVVTDPTKQIPDISHIKIMLKFQKLTKHHPVKYTDIDQFLCTILHTKKNHLFHLPDLFIL